MGDKKREPLGPPVVAYVCDRKACENCSPECKHTCDIVHAVNFEKIPNVIPVMYMEKEEPND